MKGNGRMTCSTDMGMNVGLTDPPTWGHTSMGRSREWDSTNGMMGLNMEENGTKIRYMGL